LPHPVQQARPTVKGKQESPANAKGNAQQRCTVVR